VRGVELFADGETARRFAPRLLRGYLRELPKAEVRPAAAGGAAGPAAGAAGNLVEEAARMLEETPARSARAEFRDRGEGVREVTLFGAGSKPIAHGLLVANRIVHLAVFE